MDSSSCRVPETSSGEEQQSNMLTMYNVSWVGGGGGGTANSKLYSGASGKEEKGRVSTSGGCCLSQGSMKYLFVHILNEHTHKFIYI
jgi:hypothetical protein